MRLIAILISVCLSAAPAMAEEAAPRRLAVQELAELSLAASEGSGRINGKDMEVLVLTGVTLEELQAKLQGRYTTRLVSQDGGRGLMVSDARSAECPRCTRPSLENATAIARWTYTFSMITLPKEVGGSLVIGTPLSPLHEAVAKGPTAYQGTALPQLPEGTLLDLESGFRFGQGVVDTTVASLSIPPGQARTLFVEGLAKAGFVREGDLQPEAAAAMAPVQFRRGQTVVTLMINAGPSGSDSKVILHEVSVP